MANTLSGADLEALDQLETTLKGHASTLRQLTKATTVGVATLELLWRGPDASSYKQGWTTTHRPLLDQASEELLVAAETIHKNRAAQERTSAADGNAPASSGGGLLGGLRGMAGGLTDFGGDVLGGISDVGGAVFDRGSTLAVYAWDTSRRRLSNPVQTLIDIKTGTVFLEDLAATSAIVGMDGELKRDGDYCGGDMTCIVGVSTPMSAITLGHTVLFDETDSSEALVAHEAQHVYDVERLGGHGFYGRYIAESILQKTGIIEGDGYRDLTAEDRAYHVQDHYEEGVRPAHDLDTSEPKDDL